MASAFERLSPHPRQSAASRPMSGEARHLTDCDLWNLVAYDLHEMCAQDGILCHDSHPDRMKRLARFAQRTSFRCVEAAVNLQQRIVRYISSVEMSIFEVHQRANRDDLGAGFVYQLYH